MKGSNSTEILFTSAFLLGLLLSPFHGKGWADDATTLFYSSSCAELDAGSPRAEDGRIPEDPGSADGTDTLGAILDHPLVSGYESVVMVTDRETYIAGENVWFSMFTSITGGKGIPRSLAGYAEILNSSNVAVSQCRILLDNDGTGSGLLALPDSISSGDYLLRGYTRAMTAYGPDHFFTLILRVFNPYSKGDTYTLISQEKPRPGPAIELFPEGGTLPEGIPTRVVVRTAGPDRKGMTTRVVVFSGDRPGGDTIITDKYGLGSLIVTPGPDGRLRAIALTDSVPGESQTYRYGTSPHSLVISSAPDGRKEIMVRHIPSGPVNYSGWLYLAVINERGLMYLRKFKPGNDPDIFDIQGYRAGRGISECLLYDETGRLLSARLFKDNSTGKYRTDTGGMEEAGVSGKVKLIVSDGVLKASLPDDSVKITLSVGISDGRQASFPENRLLLSGWITAGAMADPFMQPFLSGEADLDDDLLITIQDRHLASDRVRHQTVIAETRGITIDCEATSPGKQMPVSGKRFFINLPGKECFLQYATSDDDGRFTFIVPPRTGPGEIVIYPEDTTLNTVIKPLSPYSSDAIPLSSSVRNVAEMTDRSVVRMSVNSQVMRIYQIRDTDTAAADTDTRPGNHFYGRPEQRLVMTDYIALPEMEEFFFELIPGWLLTRTRKGYEFRLSDPVTGSEIRSTPLMFIDGTVTTDPGTIAGVSPYTTDYIDLFTWNFRLGDVLLPPMVNVVTKNGDNRTQVLPPGAMRFNYRFSNFRVNFRTSSGEGNGHIPLLSNTLLWIPSGRPAGGRELSFSVPGPDFKRAVKATLVVVDREGDISIAVREINPSEF